MEEEALLKMKCKMCSHITDVNKEKMAFIEVKNLNGDIDTYNICRYCYEEYQQGKMVMSRGKLRWFDELSLRDRQEAIMDRLNKLLGS